MSFANKAYTANIYMRSPHTHNERAANDAPENFEYVRARRRKQHIPSDYDDIFPCRQRSWKGKRRTQYRPKGRNVYQIIVKYKHEDEHRLDRYWRQAFRYKLWDREIENHFKDQGIVVREFTGTPTPETPEIDVRYYKVYGDLNEGVRCHFQKVCDRYGAEMKVDSI